MAGAESGVMRQQCPTNHPRVSHISVGSVAPTTMPTSTSKSLPTSTSLPTSIPTTIPTSTSIPTSLD